MVKTEQRRELGSCITRHLHAPKPPLENPFWRQMCEIERSSMICVLHNIKCKEWGGSLRIPLHWPSWFLQQQTCQKIKNTKANLQGLIPYEKSFLTLFSQSWAQETVINRQILCNSFFTFDLFFSSWPRITWCSTAAEKAFHIKEARTSRTKRKQI